VQATRSLALIVVVPALLMGCGDDTPSRPRLDVSQSVSTMAHLLRPVQTLDDRYAEIARIVPGFGGLFLDGSGRPTVYLEDPGKLAALRPVIMARISVRELQAADWRVLPTRYPYDSLLSWERAIEPRIVSGVWADIDERENRVAIGLASDADSTSLRRTARALGIPDGALSLLFATPPRPASCSTLVSVCDTVRSGIAVTRVGGNSCTLGPSVASIYDSDKYYLVNSHCTDSLFMLDSAQFYQPIQSYGVYMGQEVWDIYQTYWRAFLQGIGRASDVAVVKLSTSLPSVVGMIAKTIDTTYGWGGGVGSLTVATPSYLSVATMPASMISGSVVHKVGATSGHTSGVITQTCHTLLSYGRGKLWCQYDASAYTAPGDSGSPVLVRFGGDSVKVVGIVWGSNPSIMAMTFSPSEGISEDLGHTGTYYLTP
jgi:hypothetical protein